MKSIPTIVIIPDAPKNAIAVRLPTVEDLEDMFTDLADDKAKVETMSSLIVDTNNVIITEVDIHRIIFVFDWFIANIIYPNFVWTTFTGTVYVADIWAEP